MENPIYKSMILDVPTIPLRSKGYAKYGYLKWPLVAMIGGVAQIKGVQPQ